MNKRFNRKWLAAGLLLAGLLIAGVVWAAPLALELDWWTADGGGGTSTGGSYALSGTIGQPDAGALSGGGYQLNGGFWAGGGEVEYLLYQPAVMQP